MSVASSTYNEINSGLSYVGQGITGSNVFAQGNFVNNVSINLSSLSLPAGIWLVTSISGIETNYAFTGTIVTNITSASLPTPISISQFQNTAAVLGNSVYVDTTSVVISNLTGTNQVYNLVQTANIGAGVAVSSPTLANPLSGAYQFNATRIT
jgi:hypothetical protein